MPVTYLGATGDDWSGLLPSSVCLIYHQTLAVVRALSTNLTHYAQFCGMQGCMYSYFASCLLTLTHMVISLHLQVLFPPHIKLRCGAIPVIHRVLPFKDVHHRSLQSQNRPPNEVTACTPGWTWFFTRQPAVLWQNLRYASWAIGLASFLFLSLTQLSELEATESWGGLGMRLQSTSSYLTLCMAHCTERCPHDVATLIVSHASRVAASQIRLNVYAHQLSKKRHPFKQ